MKKIRLAIILCAMLVLGACSDDDKKEKAEEPSSEGVGFSLSGDSIEEATGVPVEEKERILEAFDVYIDTLNEKDIEKYLETLSGESYDIEEQRAFTTDQLNEYDINREVSSVTIVKYNDTEAQVYADVQMKYKQLATGLETNPSGRQVTVFTKDEGEWKVASLHYLGDNEKNE